MRHSSRDVRGRFQPRWVDDPFDPRGWPLVTCQTVTIDTYGDEVALLDCEDYEWAIGHTWTIHRYKYSHKLYARTWIDGRWFYLHRLIAERFLTKPSKRHVLVDHKDSDGLNNRRGNLRWATPSENNFNRYGFFARQVSFNL